MRIVCPMCKRVLEDAPTDFPPRPFCSARCKLADLHNWLSESYRISSPLDVSEYGDVEPDASSGTTARGKHS
ncbi:MAG TPA: DNA gyrase inhibitor YacG [Polyangiaceae bacterium]|nr:DNA gyrase inhibitor YacG [Polyangiaceae bacterium]